MGEASARSSSKKVDMAVKEEIERTRRVCLAEKNLGLTEDSCD
jgi:hypothetical protein